VDAQALEVLTRAYSRVASLRDALNGLTINHVTPWYIDEFHGVLDRLKGIGLDVEEFRHPPAAIQRPAPRSDIGRGAPTTYGHPYVDRALLLSKLSTVIGRFVMSPSEKRPIGFRA
jgi:hypothetical protein